MALIRRHERHGGKIIVMLIGSSLHTMRRQHVTTLPPEICNEIYHHILSEADGLTAWRDPVRSIRICWRMVLDIKATEVPWVSISSSM